MDNRNTTPDLLQPTSSIGVEQNSVSQGAEQIIPDEQSPEQIKSTELLHQQQKAKPNQLGQLNETTPEVVPAAPLPPAEYQVNAVNMAPAEPEVSAVDNDKVNKIFVQQIEQDMKQFGTDPFQLNEHYTKDRNKFLYDAYGRKIGDRNN